MSDSVLDPALDLTAFWDALNGVPTAADAEALFVAGGASGPGSPAAGALRRANLDRYLRRFGPAADTILVAEAPGWRGMTNTGIPFTSMRELQDPDGLFADVPFSLPPEPTAPWEASSRVVHAALRGWHGPLPVLWAVFPHHPFVAPDRLTNRTPRPAEVRDGAPVALALAEAVGARRFVAVGRKAQGALASAGIDAIAVRHPAQGGATQFTQQLAALR
ncbi:uracil-DNA glycosylase [Curtobacterium sp. MCPF17_001]|uniref:uracil-DNA glycosylase n=1 Tax=Curtobacterium sp. MCPF17_001 TaxID=2175651 RepID=UPI0021ABF451|nr:uracil-DNA glycosylase [Curtobacterium sp. MCPF17_001]